MGDEFAMIFEAVSVSFSAFLFLEIFASWEQISQRRELPRQWVPNASSERVVCDEI
jgi:hypothetical protein